MEIEANDKPTITSGERRFALGVWCAVAILTSIPYLWAWGHTPSRHEFIGLVDKIPDGMSYFAKMRQGLDGNWLFANRYSCVNHPPVLLNPLFLAMGHLAGLCRFPLHWVFHGSRLLFSWLMLQAAWAFLAEVLATVRQRRVALALFAFSSGLGWLLPQDVSGFWVRQQSVDLWMPEAIAFYAMMVNPIFSLSMALMVYVLAALSRSLEGCWKRTDLWAVPAVVLLALIHPYDIITIEIVGAAAYVTLLLTRERRTCPKFWMVLSAAPLPVVAYDFYIFHANPVMHGWLSQNRAPSPDLLWYGTAYAPLLAFAVAGLFLLKPRPVLSSIALTWLIIGLPLAFSPLSFQRKLIMGWSLPLSIAAALGVLHCWDRLAIRKAHSLRVALGLCSVLLFSLTNVVLILCIAATSTAPDSPSYLKSQEANAMRWLSRHTDAREAVLATPRLGLCIPALAGNRVLAGHWSETPDFFRMCGVANEFFATGTTSRDRSCILREYGISLVLSDSGDIADFKDIPLRRVWKSGDLRIYRYLSAKKAEV